MKKNILSSVAIAAVAAFIQRASSGIFILRILHLRVKI